jgi:ribulose-phosphate 3-epimerase
VPEAGGAAVKAYVSLWSADLLAVGAAVDAVADVADGFHVDVFDGHNVPELLFGPDFVAALRGRTRAMIDVHLNVEDPAFWARRFEEAGADMVTVQPRACADAELVLKSLREHGLLAGIGLEVGQPVAEVERLLPLVDRVLVMGTSLGVKGADLDPESGARIGAVREALRRSGRSAEVVVDGGIRRHTVGTLAAAGADGVVPGSLVLGDGDPRGAITWLHSLSGDEAVSGRA